MEHLFQMNCVWCVKFAQHIISSYYIKGMNDKITHVYACHNTISTSYASATLQVCEPRWRNSHYLRTHKVYLMNGACYLTENPGYSQPTWDTILPLNSIGNQHCLLWQHEMLTLV
jgi:hypothetical protein